MTMGKITCGFFITTAVVLLSQYTRANATRETALINDTSKRSQESTANASFTNIKYIYNTVNEISKLSEESLTEFKKLFENLMREAEATTDGKAKKEKLQKFVEHFEKYLEAVEEFKKNYDALYNWAMLDHIPTTIKKYILVVTDSKSEEMFIQALLEKHNFRPLAAKTEKNADEFKKILKNNVYELYETLGNTSAADVTSFFCGLDN